MQCNEEVAFQHPKYDFVVQRYEILGLHDRCKKVVIGLLGIRIGDRSHERREGRDGRLWEITFEFSSKGGKPAFQLIDYETEEIYYTLTVYQT
jgi:hypothetical protein